jgi:intracellular sulfur oxidation DsrE/DsrF family protein
MENPVKTTLFAALALTVAGVALAQTPPPAAPAKHKVVFQMNVADNDSWNQLFGNIGNAQKAFQKDGIQIEVVFYGKGITALLKTNTEYAERLQKAAAEGVVLGACQNSMRARKITSQDIFPFSTEVDSGVAELIRKQEAGFSYIRAGE